MAKVLVVGDEELTVEGIKFNLGQGGMNVECTYDGEEVINLVREKEFDVVPLNVMFPKFDGHEACQATRELPKVSIVILIAKGNDMDKILGLEYDVDDYITKLLNTLEMKARIKVIL